MFTRLSLCLLAFSYVCLSYSCSPLFYNYLFVLFYLCLTYMYLPNFTHVFSWSPVYFCLPMFNNVYSCLPMFTNVYLGWITHVYPFYSPLAMFTRKTYVYHILPYVYLCFLMFTYVYSCSPMFTIVYSCLFTYVYPSLLVFAYVNSC